MEPDRSQDYGAFQKLDPKSMDSKNVKVKFKGPRPFMQLEPSTTVKDVHTKACRFEV